MPTHANEETEWLSGRIDAWVETYKKAMLTPVVLAVISERQPLGIADVATSVQARTGWNLTERGLYRTIRRLEDQGLVGGVGVSVPRTGAQRKELTLTTAGEQFLSSVRGEVVDLAPRATSSDRLARS